MLGGGGRDEVRREARFGPLQARRSAARARRQDARVPRTAAGRPAVGRGREDGGAVVAARRSAPSATSRGRRAAVLERLLGEASAQHLTKLAHGDDDRAVIPYEAPKSIGHEETFERDLDDMDEILRELLHLSGRVAARLRDDGYRARTVTLKVRLANFTTLTRARTLPGRDRRRRRPVSHGRRAVPGAARRRPAGAPAGRAGVGAAGRRAPNSSRCCAASGGATSSERSIASSIRFGKGAATQATLLDRRHERVQPPEPKPHEVARTRSAYRRSFL